MFCGRFSATTVKFLKVWPRSFGHKYYRYFVATLTYIVSRRTEADGILDFAGLRRAIRLAGERGRLLKSETSVVHNELLTIRSVKYPVDVCRSGLKAQLNPSQVKNVIEILRTIDFSKLFELLTSIVQKTSGPTSSRLSVKVRRKFI